MIYGYARVSTTNQNIDNQIKQLQEYGVDKLYKEKISGRRSDRPEFLKMLDEVQQGDTVAVTRLDRFARSTVDALKTIDYLDNKGVKLVILNVSGDILDTSSSVGRFMVTMLSAVSQFEVELSKERQMEGIDAAKKRGVYYGRPKKYTKNHMGLSHAIELYKDRHNNGYTVQQICDITKVSRPTLYRNLK